MQKGGHTHTLSLSPCKAAFFLSLGASKMPHSLSSSPQSGPSQSLKGLVTFFPFSICKLSPSRPSWTHILYLVQFYWVKTFHLWKAIIGLLHKLLQSLHKAYTMGPIFWSFLSSRFISTPFPLNIPFFILYSLSISIK